MSNRNYETVSEALKNLNQRGYDSDFNLISKEECLVCNKTLISLPPEDFKIDEVYRFEGNTDPGDEMIVFAISSDKFNLKGVLVNAFGVYSSAQSSKIVEKLIGHL